MLFDFLLKNIGLVNKAAGKLTQLVTGVFLDVTVLGAHGFAKQSAIIDGIDTQIITEGN